MALIVKDRKILKEKPHLGLHPGILVFVVDVGTHIVKTQWGDKAEHLVVFCWEIEQLMQEGENAGLPFMVSSRYNFSLYNSHLSKMLESWFAKKISKEKREAGIDLEGLIGRKATLNLIESASGEYINIGSVLPPGKDNVLIPYRKEQPNWLLVLKETSVEKSKEYEAAGRSGGESSDQEPPQDDLPF
jgi:hypothetical protein